MRDAVEGLALYCLTGMVFFLGILAGRELFKPGNDERQPALILALCQYDGVHYRRPEKNGDTPHSF
jgi:hypothetical protein